jgi:hypothetical protein
MVNKIQRGMNIEEAYLQEDLLSLGIKEPSIIVKETTKEKIEISQGMNPEALHHKEYHLPPGIKVSFLFILLLVINLDINL